jgi:hypothetical protein
MSVEIIRLSCLRQVHPITFTSHVWNLILLGTLCTQPLPAANPSMPSAGPHALVVGDMFGKPLSVDTVVTDPSNRKKDAAPAGMRLEYENPVWDGYLADPQVLKTGGEYYAYGTGPAPIGVQFCQIPRSLVRPHGLEGRVSAGTVSDLNQKMYERIETWRNRKIEKAHAESARQACSLDLPPTFG